ncbi:hypothetical protein D7I39_11100 [Allopusillimonas ginsengisoli]|nr:hypothetical protein D7I39_11100 [Allopusillimonas ginsengisoli]
MDGHHTVASGDKAATERHKLESSPARVLDNESVTQDFLFDDCCQLPCMLGVTMRSDHPGKVAGITKPEHLTD